jgi:hypothetical protein
MAIFLRILIIFIFLVSGGILYMSIMLFSDREVIKTRTLRLEDSIINIAAFVEDEQKPEETAPELNQESVIEEQDLDKVTIDPKALHTIFKLDLFNDPTGQTIWRDEVTKLPTTQDEEQVLTDRVLDNLLVDVTAQYERLNETRQRLRETRMALIRTEQELADTQAELERTRQQLEDARQEINRLNDVIRQKDEIIAAKDAEIEDLNNQIAAKLNEIQGLKDVIADREAQIVNLEREVQDLRGKLGTRSVFTDVEPGPKGVVTQVSDEWRFVIFKVNTQEDLNSMKPNVELVVKRGSTSIGKVRVDRVDEETGDVVGDVLNVWTGQRIRKGDEVIY